MPCEFCLRFPQPNQDPQSAYNHTLIRCRVIVPQIEFHHQRNMQEAQYPSFQHQPTYTIDMLRTPLLKRLAKRLGSIMNRTIPDLRRYCLDYYHSVRRAFLASFPNPPPLLESPNRVESTQQQPVATGETARRVQMARRVLSNLGFREDREPPIADPSSQSLFEYLGIYRPSYITEPPIQQGVHAIAVGTNAGSNHQGNHAIAVGAYAGPTRQNTNAVAVGAYAGPTRQNNNAVAVGANRSVSVVGGAQAFFGGGQQPPQPKIVLRFQKEDDDKVIGELTEGEENMKTKQDKTTCCICLETDTYIKTNCGHVFCNCILQHLSKNGVSCPMCRQPVNQLNYGDAEHLDTTLKMLPMLSAPLQHLFCSETT